MKVIKEYIFPTVAHVFDNVLEPEHIDSMKEDIIKGSIEKKRGNWQSNPRLHEHKKYKALSDKALEAAKYVLNEQTYEYDTCYITNMWSNILKPGEMHKPHTHSNNLLSGVFYVQSDEGANIQMYDPRPQADVLRPQPKKYTKENSSIWFFPSITNRMILFPSWLQHLVPINQSKNDRISIAFNFMLKGKIGSEHNYQSAEF